jgi:transposase-like protein
MMPINVLVSERRAVNLLAQIRWRDGVYCPRCLAEHDSVRQLLGGSTVFL